MATAFEVLFVMTLVCPAVVLVLMLLAIAFVPRRRVVAKPTSHAHAA